MKKVLIIGVAAFAVGAMNVHSQGTVTFANFSSNKVTRIDTGASVANNPSGGWKVSLYWLPDQASAPVTGDFGTNNMVATTTIGVPVAGQFSGGTVTIPGIPAGGLVWAQVRGWEALYGGSTFTTYEQAIASTPSGAVGRAALAGTSNVFQIDTGDPTTVPQGTPGNLSGMRTFALVPVPEPSVIGLGVLGIGALLLLRRRK